ncbi:MAG: TonB-dependent receptor, partial [Balneolaceae bacterium]
NNSAFGTEINTVFYPKFSASYVISDEEFFDVDLIDELRIRAAWGQAGSAPGPFDATQTYGTTATTLPNGTSVSALQYVTFGNPDLKPERGSEIEIGFDIAMFRSRVELEATYYNTTTKDALISVPIAPSIGFSGSQLQNLGEISNQGFEFLLKVVPLISNQFRIEHTISVTTNKNELVSFGDGRDPVRFGVYAPVHRFAEGYPLGGFWSTPVQRDANGNVITGPNGQPLVEAEQTYKGPSAPTREIGLGTTVTMFGNIQLYALFDYKGGNYQFNVKDWRRDRSGVSWETINPDADPREVLARRFAGQTDIHIQKADFIKFRDLSVRYIVPTRFVSRLNISGASITLAGHNLAIWTKYGGADPEINFHGASTFDRNDSWTLPMTRRFSASVNLQF